MIFSQFLASGPVNIKDKYFTDHPAAAVAAASPGKLVSSFLANSMVVAGSIFLFMIVFAGFKIVVGAGANQSAQDAAKARAALTWSVVGFLIVAFAFLILQVVGAMLGAPKIANFGV